MRGLRPNPYCAFKDDRERRRALNVRNVCVAIAVVAVAWGPASAWGGALRWLVGLFH